MKADQLNAIFSRRSRRHRQMSRYSASAWQLSNAFIHLPGCTLRLSDHSLQVYHIELKITGTSRIEADQYRQKCYC